MTKRKPNYPGAEVEITLEVREAFEDFTEEEIETGVVASSFALAEPGSEGMERGLFEDLAESIKEAGAILRGEREAARRTRFDGADDVVGGGRGRPGDSGSDEAEE